ncbi:MAG TPA: hypothetical protein VGX71_21320 [Pseudaminobacter sp.]|nr:hypothetical protein [Pseudaminobacter sp.]
MAAKSHVAKLFEDRISHHASCGKRGREIFEALAVDDALPGLLESDDVASILGILPGSLKRRRKDGEPPEFIRIGGRLVKYPRPAFCEMLAAGYRSVAA